VGRFAGLEGYRGLAALVIVVYHVYQEMRSGPAARYPYEGTPIHVLLVGLDSFVGLFFVLSAFLLGLPYARAALAGAQPQSARTFLSRRTIRIVPLYLVAILLVWSMRTESFPGDWLDLLEHLTFTQVFDNHRIFYTIGPAWSLAVEVHFYLLLALLGPAMCGLCRRIPATAGRFAVLLGAVLVLGAVGVAWKAVAWHSLHVGEKNWSVWFGLPAKLDIFAVGLLLAIVVAYRGEHATATRATRIVVAGTGLLVLVFAFATRDTGTGPRVFFHTSTALGFGLVLAATVLAGPAGTGRVLGWPMLIRLGLISYSLYLWHEPVMLYLAGHHLFPTPGTWYGFPVGVVVLSLSACLVAWCSYWVIEYPTGMLRRRPRAAEAAPRR
jgi:peptidoglycan/LPS O-acetylase OafA/YrhL